MESNAANPVKLKKSCTTHAIYPHSRSLHSQTLPAIGLSCFYFMKYSPNADVNERNSRE